MLKKKKKEEETKEKKTPDRGFWNNLKSTYKYAKTGRKYLFIFLFFNTLMTAISIIFPILSAKQLVALTNTLYTKLLIFTVVMFILEITQMVCRFLANGAFNNFYYNVRKNVQLELTRETLKITQEELNTNSSGIFIERINSDADEITQVFANLIDYITELIGYVGILIALFLINFWVGLVYTLALVGLSFLIKHLNELSNKARKEFKKEREKVSGFTSEIVRGAKDIKILDAEESFLKKADSYMTEANKVSYAFQIRRAKNRLMIGSSRSTVDFAATMLLYFLLISNIITLDTALIINNYSYRIIWIADIIDQITNQIKEYNLSANRIFGILEGNEFKKEEFGTKELKNFQGNIEFKDVCFSYEEDVPVLKNMNLSIKANQTVGFVGASGAGKSTIFNLICALNRPTSGSIYFDGNDTKELTKSSIRSNLSVISQNAYIFNMSIYDNLKVVKANATKKEIEEVCKLACLDEFINKLPDKYDTIVGEGGVTLSGGQKQRLAIARALLLKTEILLFDEATSALDNETQQQIQKAINNLKGEYTILIVAHRLSTVMDCDKIFVIGEGKVLDQGKHKYLLKNSRTYKRLYKKESEATEEKKENTNEKEQQ